MVASTPNCNSLGILTLLDKPAEWNRFEREVWQRSKSKASLELSSTLRRIKINRPDIVNLEDLNDSLLHQIRQKTKELEKRTANTQYDFRTEDFNNTSDSFV